MDLRSVEAKPVAKKGHMKSLKTEQRSVYPHTSERHACSYPILSLLLPT